MKLTGKVTSVLRTVAKSHLSETFDEKRTFAVQVRPATKLSSYYAYGSMTFTLNGQELDGFPAELNQDVELYLVPVGGDAPTRAIDDVSYALYEVQGKLDVASQALITEKAALLRANSRVHEISERAVALQTENVRLTTELETLRAARLSHPTPDIDMKRIST